ncbi:hypothetical protein [Caballeronia sp. dw_19]|uniref:hypothetical protein n=1 Tax=Caballeronia sp. dw_19 TaxID=2719791 RepID=UPI001BD3D09D|nr:hypothetical protein [Caballeronia sp. dw_19]
MKFSYKSVQIDVTPQVTATGFRARAKLQRAKVEGQDIAGEQHASDLGSCLTAQEAVDRARTWAIAFCDENWA